MDIMGMLDEFQKKAMKDPALAAALLATEKEAHPLDAFCRICQAQGYPIYVMDLVSVGEEFYATMRRSTNGGGENSPKLEGEDDFYELFLAALRYTYPEL